MISLKPGVCLRLCIEYNRSVVCVYLSRKTFLNKKVRSMKFPHRRVCAKPYLSPDMRQV